MKLLFPTIFFLFTTATYGQTRKNIIIGTIDSIYSNTLKEGRNIMVHLPMTPSDEFSPAQKYPVIYVLDGEVLFQHVVTISEALSGGSGNYMYPKMIVVGITNTGRTRDLTPTHSTDGTVMPGFLLQTSGGGEKFASFLETELIPYIESQYPAAPYRTIIGHSLGGLTSIYHLVNRRSLFQAFVAIDPSMWWDKLNYLQLVKQAIITNKSESNSLYVAIANSMDKKLTLQTVAKDKSPATLPIRAILEFDRFMKDQKNSKLIYKSKYYHDYDHGSLPLVAIYDALPYVFNFYLINFPFNAFFNPEYKNDSILITHYKNVTKRMGYKVSPPGELVDALSHQLMDMKQFERAYKFLQLNLNNYPDSYKPYEALGDYYQATGNAAQAEKLYIQALTLNENPTIREKMEKLKSK